MVGSERLIVGALLPVRRPGSPRRRLAAGVLAALLAACTTVTPSPSPAPSATPVASPAPAGSPAPSATPAAQAWADLGTPPARRPVATLTPVGGAAGPIAPTAAFELASASGEPAAAIAARLTVEPAAKLTVTAGKDAAHVVVRPAAGFATGALVRFRLAAADGTLLGSWAYQVDRPPHVVGVLPGVDASEVPVSTGIEVAFDQDGVVVTRADFAISPAVSGHVETHGRVVAFVPDALKRGTVYTVTLRAGVRQPGSAYALERAVTWRFETDAAPGDPRADAWLQSGRSDGTPRDRTALYVERDTPDEVQPIAAGRIAVQRIDDRSTAIALGRQLSAMRSMFAGGRHQVVPTKGLPLVLRASLPFVQVGESGWNAVQLPRPLASGWYLVTLTANGRPSQTVLQVTDLAPYVLATRKRTLVWVNDVTRRAAVAGVRVRLAGGPTLGRTDTRGIFDLATPAALRAVEEDEESRFSAPAPRADRVLLLDAADGRRAYVALDTEGFGATYRAGSQGSGSANARWWSALSTDRLRYRTTDTIDAWGVLRARAGRAVPETVTLRLVAEVGSPAVARATARPDARGAFAATLAVGDLPAGSYYLQLLAGGSVVQETWLEIGVIRKPAYRLAVAADRWAMHAGTDVGVQARATFYEGTPAAGVDLALDVMDQPGRTLTTGQDGTADGRAAVDMGEATDQRADVNVQVSASAPEEGRIEAATQVIVFRGSEWVDAAAALAGRRLTVSGAVHVADVARLNALPTLEAAMSADPRGAPVAGARVRLAIVERWTVRVRTGTAYDPITKQTVPTYETQERSRSLPAVAARTRADGTFRVRLAVTGGTRSYEIAATTVDPEGRSIATSAWAESAAALHAAAPLSFGEVPGNRCPVECSVGQVYTVPLVGATRLPSGGAHRYLFLVEQEGLRRWTLASTPVHRETFRASDVPNVLVDAVWFDGLGYVVPAGRLEPRLKVAARELTVSVSPDRGRYAPGATARLAIRVTDRGGRPVRATVVVAVVDQRLLDVTGGPPVADPGELLYASMGDGVELMVAFPARPYQGGKGGGATTGGPGDGGGGDARADFRDALLFTTVATGADGTAKLSVALSDDLTSWRVAAGAVDGRLRGGVGLADLGVGLPFFAEATIAPEYLAADRPAIQVRAFGSAVAATAAVTWTVRSETLPMAAVTVTGAASTGALVPLAALTPGVHRLTITADDGLHRDTLVRTFNVIASRRTRAELQAWTVTGTLRPGGSAAGFTTFLVSDAGRGAFVPRLYEMAAEQGSRADQAVAARAARRLLERTFGIDPTALPPDPATLDLFRSPEGGLAVVAYGGRDLELTVRALLADPTSANARTAAWLRGIADSPLEATDGQAETPERRSVALVGLAALGEPILERILARIAAPDTTPRESLWLALGAVALGDETTGASVARTLADRFGQRSGVLVRLAVSDDPNEIAEATARFAALAAAVGDPLAEPALAYATANPRTDDLAILEELLAIRGFVARLAAVSTAVAWTVDGDRTNADLSNGRAIAITVTPAQRASLAIEAVEGRISVVGRWDVVGAPTVPGAPATTIGRTAVPSGEVPRTAVVRVRINVAFATNAPAGTYRVVELVPSGLAPLDQGGIWRAEAEAELPPRCELPYLVDGQRLEFSAAPPANGRPQPELCYLARVVTPGTYLWEPATITAEADTATWSSTTQATVTIR